jgi:hypothetical protein
VNIVELYSEFVVDSKHKHFIFHVLFGHGK